MIVLGLICLILGLVLGIGILWTIGIILLVVGLILELLGTMARGGRETPLLVTDRAPVERAVTPPAPAGRAT